METRVFNLISKINALGIDNTKWSLLDFSMGMSSARTLGTDDDVTLYGRCLVLWENGDEYRYDNLPAWWTYNLPLVGGFGKSRVYIYPLKTIDE